MPRTDRTRLAAGASLAIALLLAACAGAPPSNQETGATFIVVRHAEKADASRDPDLGPAGQARAQALAGLLDGEPLLAVYATEFRRTTQTVKPSADAHHLALTAYPAAVPASEFAQQLRAAHPRGRVLVAGHSNTVPAIVAALCGCDTAPMREDEFDRLSTVRINANGRASLSVLRYGAASEPE